MVLPTAFLNAYAVEWSALVLLTGTAEITGDDDALHINYYKCKNGGMPLSLRQQEEEVTEMRGKNIRP